MGMTEATLGPRLDAGLIESDRFVVCFGRGFFLPKIATRRGCSGERLSLRFKLTGYIVQMLMNGRSPLIMRPQVPGHGLAVRGISSRP